MDYKKITILLTDGGDRQTLPLSKALKSLGCQVSTLNASRLDNGYSSRYPDEKILDKSILKDKKNHFAAIEKYITSGKYDVVITTSDDTAEFLANNKIRFSEFSKIAVADKDLFYMAYDKNNTMQVCMENNIPCPKTYFNINTLEDLLSQDFVFPLVVKPRKSYGAIGYKKIDTPEELKSYCCSFTDISSFVFQEYIPQSGIQFECAMFVDNYNSVKTSAVFSKNRWFPVDGGSSTLNITVDRPDIVESCTKLLQTINWRGAADIDLILDPRDSVAKIMEINPRVSGSVKIILDSGINIAKQIIDSLYDIPVDEYTDYKKGIRLRCTHTDLLWFIKSPDRFKAKPSWFSCKNTHDQIFSASDPWPFFTFSMQALAKYKREMKKRER